MKGKRMSVQDPVEGPIAGILTLIVCVALAALVLAGCDRSVATAPIGEPAAADKAPVQESVDGGSPAVRRDLAALRRLTAPFHDVRKAGEAGWNVQLTGCLANPPEGAMGYHYANTAFIDAEARVLEPELLLYEPESNGRLRLVGVEYIIPYSLVPAASTPPVLFGHEFHHNDAFQLWGLHAWIWRHNPAGMFADWNPMVTCRYAS